MKTLHELATAQRETANALFRTDESPCTEHNDTDGSCLVKEENRPLARKERANGDIIRTFRGYDPGRMCNSCAAYWHAEMAAQILHNMHCWAVRRGAAESVRAAKTRDQNHTPTAPNPVVTDMVEAT